MEPVITILLSDHELFKGMLDEISRAITARRKPPSTPAEVYSLLGGLIEVIHRISVLVGMVEEHRKLEENTIYPYLEGLGFDDEVEELRRHHSVIKEHVRTFEVLLREYREMRADISTVVMEVSKGYSHMRRLLIEHFGYEEQLFAQATRIVDRQ